MGANSFRDYIGTGEWTGSTECDLIAFADEMAELERERDEATVWIDKIIDDDEWWEEVTLSPYDGDTRLALRAAREAGSKMPVMANFKEQELARIPALEARITELERERDDMLWYYRGTRDSSDTRTARDALSDLRTARRAANNG